MIQRDKFKEVISWAEGKKKSELPKYTWWSSSKDCAKLGGFTVENIPHLPMEVGGSIKVIAHTSHGESYWKHFDIPLDKVKEFCNTLMRARDFALKNKNKIET